MAMSIMQGLTDPEAKVDPASTPLNLDGITYYFGRWQNDAFGKCINSLINQILASPREMLSQQFQETAKRLTETSSKCSDK